MRYFIILLFVLLFPFPGNSQANGMKHPAVPDGGVSGTPGGYLNLFSYVGKRFLEECKKRFNLSELEVQKEKLSNKNVYYVKVATQDNKLKVSQQIKINKKP